MKIIIIGAGQVGSTLTEKLVTEKNDLTVIDTDEAFSEYSTTSMISEPSAGSALIQISWRQPALPMLKCL